jgi:uncharacterized membrane protein
MTFWFLSTANAIVAAALLYAGLSKIAQPEPARRALSEVGGRRMNGIGAEAVRAIAAIEVLAGAAITVPATRMAAASVVVLLGIAFATAGISGAGRRAVEPCGCLGAGSRAPLGPRNILIGTVVAAVGAANISTPAAAVPAATASLLLATCLFAHRAAARRLLWPPRSAT